MDEKEWLWDWIKHEGNVFNARGNLFLVAESMLIVAVATMAASSKKLNSLLVLTYIGGIFVTLVWLYVNGKHRQIQGIIVRKLEEMHCLYKEIKAQCKKCPWCIDNHTMMGIILPFGL